MFRLLKKIWGLRKRDSARVILCGAEIRVSRVVKRQRLFTNLPIKNNKIVFRNHIGSYGCNVKYITEEILRQNLPYDLVWVVNEHFLKFQKDYPKNVRLVMDRTSDVYKEYASAKIWIDSERRVPYVKAGLFKKEGQVYIQTFHGSLGIKKVGLDRKDIFGWNFTVPKIDAKQIDYLISNSSATTGYLKTMTWDNGKILEVGLPRNDVFFKDGSAIKQKVYKSFNIPEGKKIILYAPTLREDRDLSCYTLDFKRLAEAASKRFGNNYVVMLRLHPLIIDLKDSYTNDFTDVIDATDYSDMQELLVSADILVTDYSSCIYDYMLSYKPGFIFATDSEKYDNGRGLYFPLSSTPFPVARNNDELVLKIENFDAEKYRIAVGEFLKGKGCIDDGHASERVVELIKQIIPVQDNTSEKYDNRPSVQA